MPTITKKQYDDYMLLRKQRDEGKLLTPDGLRFICEANDFDPEKIGKHFLEVLPSVCPSYVITEKADIESGTLV